MGLGVTHNRPILFLMVLFLFSNSIVTGQDWPMFQQNPQRTGTSPSLGPINPVLIDNFSYGDGVSAGGLSIIGDVMYFGSSDNKIYAFFTNGTKWWEFDAGGQISAAPAVENEVVYVGSEGANTFYALNATSGQQIWNFIASGWIRISSAVVINGIVYFGSYDKNVYALNSATGNLIWNFTTGDLIPSSPAFDSNILYVGSNNGKLYALNSSNGKHIWNFTASGAIRYTPTVSNGLLFFAAGDADKTFYAFNLTSRQQIWNFTPVDSRIRAAAFYEGVVYNGYLGSNATDDFHELTATNATSGARIWNISCCSTTPIISSNGIVYAGQTYAFTKHIPFLAVYAVNATNGQVLWTYTIGNTTGNFVLANGKLYIPTRNGRMLIFGPDTLPPSSVSNLINTTFQKTFITWSWANPQESDYSYAIVYIDGVFATNLSKPTSSYNLTGLSPATSHTISIRAVDTSGNVNISWVNHTASTEPETTGGTTTTASTTTTAGKGGGGGTEVIIPACKAQGGVICDTGLECPDKWLKSSDSERCCSVVCAPPKGAKAVTTTLPKPPEGIEKSVEVEVGRIEAGERKAIELERSDIERIEIVAKDVMTGVKVMVERLEEKPGEAKQPKGEVYAFLNITAENVEEKDVEAVDLTFKVDRFWVSDLGIDENSVRLIRYGEKEESYKADLVGRDERFYRYRASVKGFSTFAIVGERKESGRDYWPFMKYFVYAAIAAIIGILAWDFWRDFRHKRL